MKKIVEAITVAVTAYQMLNESQYNGKYSSKDKPIRTNSLDLPQRVMKCR